MSLIDHSRVANGRDRTRSGPVERALAEPVLDRRGPVRREPRDGDARPPVPDGVYDETLQADEPFERAATDVDPVHVHQRNDRPNPGENAPFQVDGVPAALEPEGAKAQRRVERPEERRGDERGRTDPHADAHEQGVGDAEADADRRRDGQRCDQPDQQDSFVERVHTFQSTSSMIKCGFPVDSRPCVRIVGRRVRQKTAGRLSMVPWMLCRRGDRCTRGVHPPVCYYIPKRFRPPAGPRLDLRCPGTTDRLRAATRSRPRKSRVPRPAHARRSPRRPHPRAPPRPGGGPRWSPGR